LAQELLSTFSTSLGQVSLQPSTGGIFTISIATGTATGTDRAEESSSVSSSVSSSPPPQKKKKLLLLWDRARDGGFPEVKELKRRVRDVVEPGRDLGHVDRGAKAKAADAVADADAGVGVDAVRKEEKKEEKREKKEKDKEEEDKTTPGTGTDAVAARAACEDCTLDG
ncbi:hypothetical protein E4U41_005475, partial [Claviceps citrina]